MATNFTLTEILAYAKDAFDYKLTEMSGFPFDKTTATLTGVGSSVVAEDLQDNVIQLHKFFFGEDGYAPSSVVTSISSGLQGYATGSVTDEDASVYEVPEEYYNYGNTGTGTDSGYTEQTGGTDTAGGTEAPSNEDGPVQDGTGGDAGVPDTGGEGAGDTSTGGTDQGTATE